MKISRKNLSSYYTLGAAALLCVAVFCPFNIQDALAIVTACVFGFQGAGAVGLFLVLGKAGLPVLPGRLCGTEAFTGMNGGFIWGMFFAALLCGLLMGNILKTKKPEGLLEKAEAAAKAKKTDWFYLVKIILILAAAYIVVQATGIFWYANFVSKANLEAGKVGLSYAEAFAICTKPQLLFLIVKLALSFPLIVILRKLFEPKWS